MPLQPCECVPGSPPWKQLPDIIAAVKSLGGEDNPDRTCYEGLTLSEQLTEWYCALKEIIGPSYDPDAENFFARAGDLGTEEYTDAEAKEAINTFVLYLKSQSLWEKMVALYPFVGGTANAHSQNLISSNYTIVWLGGVSHSANGITGNSSGYGDTGFLPADKLLESNCHHSHYVRSGTSGSCGCAVGSNRFLSLTPFFDNNNYFDITNDTPGDGRVSWSFSVGHILGSRISTTDLRGYEDGVEMTSSSGITVTTFPAFSYFILAFNNNGASSLPADYNLAMTTIGHGLQPNEAADLYLGIQTFQTALGRNV